MPVGSHTGGGGEIPAVRHLQLMEEFAPGLLDQWREEEILRHSSPELL